MTQPTRGSRGRWIPNLESGLLSFAIEVLIVVALALVGIAVAGIALLIF